MRFGFSAVLTVATRVSAVLLMGLASIVIARVLGPSGQGLVASLLAVVGIVLQFGNLGVYASNIRFVGEDKKLYGRASSNSLFVGVFLGVAAFIVLAGASYVFPQVFGDVPKGFLLLYAVSIPFSLLIILFQGMILAVENVKTYNLFIFLRALMVFGGACLLLLVFGGGVYELVLLLVLVEVAVCFMYLYVSGRVEKIRFSVDVALLKRMVSYGLKVYVATQMTYLVLKFDVLLVNYYLGLASTGVYSIAAKIADLLYLAPATVALIYFPRATALKDKAGAFTNKILAYLAGIMFLGCAVFYVIVKPVVLFLYGSAYAGAILPLRILVPGIFFISLETIIMNYYAAKSMPLYVVATPLIGLAVNIGLNAAWIPTRGIVGAAASSTVAYTLMFVMLFAYYVWNEFYALRRIIGR
ncbi:MAG: oligosaccharide flippase family protein [Candidatus Altiarchaeota archaeon]